MAQTSLMLTGIESWTGLVQAAGTSTFGLILLIT
jgi:hypothetical protein